MLETEALCPPDQERARTLTVHPETKGDLLDA